MDHAAQFRPHVLATFTRSSEAGEAARAVQQRYPDADVATGDKDDELDALALGGRREMHESVPAFGLFTGPFLRGALLWGAIGAVVGALLMVPLTAVVTMEGTSRWLIALLLAVIGALALSSAAFVLGAGRQAVKEGATTPEDPTAVVRVDVDADRAEEVIDFFAQYEPRTTRFIDQPVPRRSSDDVEDPRPLPDDRDTTHGAGRQYDAGFRSDVP